MIQTYKIEDHWVVAENEIWFPGAYDTEKTARYAVSIKEERIKYLMEKSETKILTMEDLKSLEDI